MGTRRNTSYQTPIQQVTSAVLAEYNGEHAIVFDATLGEYVAWNGSSWVPFSQGVETLTNRIIVNQANVATTLGGVIDSTKQYFIDGKVNMGTIEIEVPATGIQLTGFSFDVSGLWSAEPNYTMFVSPVGGSGNWLANKLDFGVYGAGSQVFDITDATGFNAFEMQIVNFSGCQSLGKLTNYRQGLEDGTGRFGGTPTLELVGTWVGGYRITTSIVRGLSAGMTEPLFKAGAGFTMNSRFLTDINCDLPPLAAFFDFAPANFVNPSTLQLKGVLMSRGGVFNANDANLTPNITSSDLASDWDKNVGMNNTFVGGELAVSVEVDTVITTTGTYETLLGTWSAADLQHFDSPASGELRHLGTDPREFRVTFDMVIESGANNEVDLALFLDDGVTPIQVYGMTRVINAFQGGRDVGYFSGTTNIIMNQGDIVRFAVANLTNTTDITAELDSQWILEER